MDPAHQITISGTTTNNGTAGNVDLICTFQNAAGTTSDSTIEDNVPVGPSGTFTFSGPVPGFERACVVRAVPAGGGLPADLSPFTGPTVGLGSFDLATLTSGPNTGSVFTFDDNAAQLTGVGNYHSLGGGGVFDAFPIQPGTLVLGADMYFGGDYVSDANADRSDLEIDGVPAYAAATAEDLVSGSENFSGLPAITFSSSQDPTTGNLTVHESETLVKCEPAPATYPPTATSCTSFASTGVKFERTIVQDQAGRQAHFTDTYSSSRRAGPLTRSPLRPGLRQRRRRVQLPLGRRRRSYKTHAAGDTIAPPPSAPATVFVNFDNTKASGDLTSAQGAITFAQAPSALKFLTKGLSAANGDTHLFASFVRSIPAGGSATLRTAYSWAYTIADAHTLAATAQQSFTPPGATTGSASSITTTGATVSGSVNPNAQATTYQFQFGTSTSYGGTTAVTSAGSGTSATAVSAALTGLKPNTNYHYRVVATNASGTTNGADATFKTKNIPTRLTVGKVKVKGITASVPLSCAGNPGVKCKGTLTETIKVKAKHKKKTVTVGKASFSISAAGKKTVKVTLNSKGRKALAKSKSHKLRATLTVKLGSKKVASRTVTFKHKAKHKKK